MASVARGLVSQKSAGGSKKGPAALALAAAGAAGGIALARRRKGGEAAEPDPKSDTTLHVSSEPVEVRGAPSEDEMPQPPAS